MIVLTLAIGRQVFQRSRASCAFLLSLVSLLFLSPVRSALADSASWVPLCTSDDFIGPQADVMTAIGGTLLITLIVMACMLVKNMLMGNR